VTAQVVKEDVLGAARAQQAVIEPKDGLDPLAFEVLDIEFESAPERAEPFT